MAPKQVNASLFVALFVAPFVALFVSVLFACTRLPGELPSEIKILLAPGPVTVSGSPPARLFEAGRYATGDVISIDTVTFRPARAPRTMSAPDSDAGLPRFAIVTTYQGTRHHAETIRALSEDTVALAGAAGALTREAASRGALTLLIDAQGLSASDLRNFVAFVRALSDSSRRKIPDGTALIIPPGDTVAYPTAVLARVVPMLVLRLYGEHRPGTAPGPLASVEWINRQVGLRAVAIGVNRLTAELPLFGYLWQRDSAARPISFVDAQRLVAAEAGSFRRDQPSGFLAYRGSTGWSVWVPDAQTVDRMIATIRRAGISRVLLSGVDGADPDLWARLPPIRR
ncbi:MAG TPA: hypothetical protein VHM24_08530 [Gemmatimonadaceae bacterium]|nr:hypothetical protein [Gemmatimonadaceae bacterium]